MRVKLLTERATIPQRMTPGSAGYDLSSAYSLVIPAKGKALVGTDLSISVPPNTYGRIAPRSGLAWKHHIDVGAGVIDFDYTVKRIYFCSPYIFFRVLLEWFSLIMLLQNSRLK